MMHASVQFIDAWRHTPCIAGLQVQMLANKHRGHAFTRALLGVPAREVHVCGDAAALPLLQQILQETGAAPALGHSVNKALVHSNKCLSVSM